MSKRTLPTYFSSSSIRTGTPLPSIDEGTSQPKRSRVEFRHSDIIGDPGNRKPIDDYPPEIRDQVRRAYAISGPTVDGDLFKALGLDCMIGWSIVCQRMQLIACIAIFSLSRESLKNLVVLFLPKMDKEVNARGTSARRKQKITNMHFYKNETFLAAIDALLSEMNHRFNEVSSELLICMAALNPRNNFSNFDVDKLVRLAEIYAEDFMVGDLILLRSQLSAFIGNVRREENFRGCRDLPRLAELMVKSNKNSSYPLVYRLIELILILPVATTSVERVFSAMSLIKTDLRSKMGDEWLNDLMICYTEKQIFKGISNEKINLRFEAMKHRRMLVPQKTIMIAPHQG